MPNLLQRIKKDLLWGGFSKDITNLSSIRSEGPLVQHHIPNEKTINLNMLSPLMKHGIVVNIFCCMIITIHYHRLRTTPISHYRDFIHIISYAVCAMPWTLAQ